MALATALAACGGTSATGTSSSTSASRPSSTTAPGQSSTSATTAAGEGATEPAPTSTTSGTVAAALPVTACATTFGVEETTVPLPGTVRKQVDRTLAGSLAVYADTTDLMEVVGPKGWSCTATVGADGSANLAVVPAGAPQPGNGPAGDTQAIVASETSACVGCTLDQACKLFPAALAALHQEYPGQHCDLPPSGETHQQLSATVVGFEDPPGISGTGAPSGGTNPANGVMTYVQTGQDGSWLETCTLPPGRHQVCTDSLNTFIAAYGSK